MTGTLALTVVSMPKIYQASPELVEKLQPFRHSQFVTQLFCPVCGTYMLSRCTGDDPDGGVTWDILTGSLEKADGAFEVQAHGHVSDTLDGGFADFLLAVDGRQLGRYAREIGNSEILPRNWKESPENLSTATDRLHAHCKCNGVEFWLSRPSEASKLGKVPWPDLIVPFYEPPRPVTDKEAWWINDDGTKYLAGLCACRSCRLACGMDEVNNDAGSKAPLTSPPALPANSVAPTVAETPNTARLVSDGGGYRYVNNHLWNALPARTSNNSLSTSSPSISNVDASTPRHSINTPAARTIDSIADSSVQPRVHGSDGRSFLFGTSEALANLSQPAANQIVQLWQIYLENVDPIMKIFHAPTVQALVLGQIGKPPLQASEQALVSAIYLTSAISMQDEHCRATFQESRHALIHKFRLATEIALSAAGFVTTTEITILQAFVLYLTALRSAGETQAVWSLCGLAIRVAGTIGLNRDGSMLDLPPFETEMRRRLHWAIVYLDARTAELVGQDGDLLVQNQDVKPPSNLNDSELFPAMQRLPESRPIPTEMLYVQFRATLGFHIRSVVGTQGSGSTWKRLGAPHVPYAEKMEIVHRLEQRFHEEILVGCDPGVPLQLYTMNAVQILLNKMQLVAQDRSNPEAFSSSAFELSMTIMNLQMELWTEPSLQRWLWHSRSQFQWFALTCLIRQTRLRGPGSLTLKAWSLIRRIFDVIIPTLELAPTKSILLDAIKSLWTTGTQEQTNQAVRQWNTATHDNRPPQHIGGPHIGSQPSPQMTSYLPPVLSSYPTPNRTLYSSPGSTRPHNALLPGMMEENTHGSVSGQSFQAPTPRSDILQNEVNNGVTTPFQTPLLDLDFNSIDWAEFDRLTNELCQQ
ncbi:bikaverin cluster transcription factor bik5 [Acrodontium crateriforme]|uniref:Bikaverin cluster transcription factor bik5 n=1 Tax=Acrodontium crateriforme TaxID=150365 RepID=A0AAQ3RB85_9PEZI|nr:bikaverin cluster transcription factor bik5 [Acrodontium crateriforme]